MAMVMEPVLQLPEFDKQFSVETFAALKKEEAEDGGSLRPDIPLYSS